MTSYLDDYTRCVSGDIEYATNFIHQSGNWYLKSIIIYKLALKNINLSDGLPTIMLSKYIIPCYRRSTKFLIPFKKSEPQQLNDRDMLIIINCNNYHKYLLSHSGLLPMSILYVRKKISSQKCIEDIFYHYIKPQREIIEKIIYINRKYSYLLDHYQNLFIDCRPIYQYTKNYFRQTLTINLRTFNLYLRCCGQTATFIGFMNEYIYALPSSDWWFYHFRIGRFIMEEY